MTTPAELTGAALDPLVDAAILSGPDASRDPLYRALLDQPLAIAWLAPDAPPGPSIPVEHEAVRLVESPALRVPVAPLYTSGAAMEASGRARGFWPDGVARGAVLEHGAAFVRLRGQAGALVIAGEGRVVPLDAGEIAALAEGQLPDEYIESLRALQKRNRGREAAQKLMRRPLYVLGHPKGGLLMFPKEIPAFFHLATADRFAARIAAQTGERTEHGLVGAGDLFRNAYRGKLSVVLDPGPASITLRFTDLRV